jgi:hypothetical protein
MATKKKEIAISLEKIPVINKLNENLSKMFIEYEQMKEDRENQIKARKEYFKKVWDYASTLEIEDVVTWNHSFRIDFDTHIPFDDVEITVGESDLKKHIEKMENLKRMIIILEMAKDETVPFSMVEEVMSYI